MQFIHFIFSIKKTLKNQSFFLMRKMGLEPTQPESYKILSLARLPVPTLPHFPIYGQLSFQITDRKRDITINPGKCQQLFSLPHVRLFSLPHVRLITVQPCSSNPLLCSSFSLRASALCQDKRGQALVSRLSCLPPIILAHGRTDTNFGKLREKT